MTVLQFVRSRTPRHTRACLTKLLAQEHAGVLKGIAFVAILETGFMTGACGAARDQPEDTIEMIEYLKERLARK